VLIFRNTVPFAFDAAGENIGAFKISGKSKNTSQAFFNKVRGAEAVTDKPRKIREHRVNRGFSRQSASEIVRAWALQRGM